MRKRTSIYLITALALAACAPKRVHERPVIHQGDRIREPVVSEAGDAAAHGARLVSSRDSLTALALATCEGDLCEAVTRGEVALGMNEAQVLAATRTTAEAWAIRDAGDATVMVPRNMDHGPGDVVAELAMIQLRDGRVSTYSYRESQGIRVVSTPADASTRGRADDLAEMLIREGDDYAARGELDAALDRYDRADVLRPNDPELTYRIATVLDKSLRPIEALIRYKLFLHQLELERIGAYGDAYAQMAAAIAHARERIIVLERHTP